MGEVDNKDLLRTDGASVNERKEKLEKIRQYRADKDTKEILSTPAGKRFVKRYLDACGVFRTPFMGEFPYTNHVNIGRQQIGLLIIGDMERAAPMAYVEMIREAKSDALLSEKLDKEAEKEMETS